MRAPVITALLMATAMAPLPAFAGPVTLMPHRAVYDLHLADSAAAGSTEEMASVAGRMVFEFTGSACEGYTVNFRFVVEMTDGEGETTVTDLRTSTFEDGPGSSFDFLSQTYTNQVLTEEVKGSATRGDEGLQVALVSPAEAKVDLGPKPIFPTDHLVKVIEAARAGRTMLGSDVFDGSETGDKVYTTATVIGDPRTGPVSDAAAAVGTTTRWPVTVSYFDAAESGDRTPDYAIGFDLFENGVSTGLHMDYGDFALDGDMTHFEALPQSTCP